MNQIFNHIIWKILNSVNLEFDFSPPVHFATETSLIYLGTLCMFVIHWFWPVLLSLLNQISNLLFMSTTSNWAIKGHHVHNFHILLSSVFAVAAVTMLLHSFASFNSYLHSAAVGINLLLEWCTYPQPLLNPIKTNPMKERKGFASIKLRNLSIAL